MKTFFRSLKKQDGFTLVELMVVVAIIGLLSAVAIPNFKKYQAKAKMSEAKLQLSSVYTAETAFFTDFNIYHSCLAYMGFNPQREVLNRYYSVGFGGTGYTPTAISTNAHDAAETAGLDIAACPETPLNSPITTVGPTDSVAKTITGFKAGKGIGSAIASMDYLPTTSNGTQADQGTMTFIAGAGGVIDGDNTTSSLASQLTINEQKVFKIIRNGY